MKITFKHRRHQKIKLVYEDQWLFAVNKPPRIASVPGEGISEPASLLGQVRSLFAGRDYTPYVLHRLDFETSGVMLFGKYSRDREALEKIFGDPSTTKTYVALVKGVPHGKIISKKLRAREINEDVPAETSYTVKDVFKAPAPLVSLVEARIHTGRKHQIRKHFSGIGHPVVMDRIYGDQHFNRKFRLRFRLGRQFLHAYAISFAHPFLKKNMRMEAPMPPDLAVVLKRLTV